MGLRAERAHPFTRGFACGKIRRYPGRLNHPDRITSPHLRVDGGYKAASWEEALDVAATSLRSALDGPGTAHYLRGTGSLGQSKLYLDYLFGHLGARPLSGSLCDEAGIAAVVEDAGALRMNHPGEIDRAEAIVLWGKHPRACSIHTARQVTAARRRGTPVLGVNPDTAAVEGICDGVIRVRPGGDRHLALAVAVILGRLGHLPGLELVSNADDFQRFLSSLSLEDLLAACDVHRREAEELADVYRRSRRVATLCGWALQRYERGSETVRAIHALTILAGTVGIPGGGFYYNAPSGRFFTSLERMAPPSVPRQPPAATPRGLCRLSLPRLGSSPAGAEAPAEFLWVSGANPLNQAPDAHASGRVFRDIGTTVVVDAFWTETARHADVVLPAALWLEEEDLVGSYWYPIVGSARRVVMAPDECRTDFQILKELETLLDCASPYESVDSWLAGRLPPGAPSLDAIRERGWWSPEEDPIAWTTGSAHPDGRFRLLTRLSDGEGAVQETVSAGRREPRGARGLRLLSLIRTEAMHSQMLPEEHTDHLTVRLHPSRARAGGLTEGQTVAVTNDRGRLEARLSLDGSLHPDAVVCPRDGWIELGRGPNVLTAPHVTDRGETAAFYETLVDVLPAEPDGELDSSGA